MGIFTQIFKAIAAFALLVPIGLFGDTTVFNAPMSTTGSSSVSYALPPLKGDGSTTLDLLLNFENGSDANLVTVSNSGQAGNLYSIREINSDSTLRYWFFAMGESNALSTFSSNVRLTFDCQITGVNSNNSLIRGLIHCQNPHSVNQSDTFDYRFSLKSGFGTNGQYSIQKAGTPSATQTVLGTAVSFTLDTTQSYSCSIEYQDGSILGKVVRKSDGQSLTSAGTFTTSAATACSATDTTIPCTGCTGMSIQTGTNGCFIYNIKIETLNPQALTGPIYTNRVSRVKDFTPTGTPVLFPGGNIIYDQPSGTFFAYGYGGSTATTSWSGTNTSQVGPRTATYVLISRDRATWYYGGIAMDWSGIAGFSVASRPEVMHCANNQTYVMWAHLLNSDGTGNNCYGVATSSTPVGPFVSIPSLTVSSLGTSCKDEGLLVSVDTGTGSANAWLVYNQATNTTSVVALTSAFTNTTGSAVAMNTDGQEGYGLWIQGSIAYCVSSTRTGWVSNANTYYTTTASNPLGTWTNRGNPFPNTTIENGPANAYRGQMGCFVKGADNVVVIKMDCWLESNIVETPAIWLLPTFGDTGNPATSTMSAPWQTSVSAAATIAAPPLAGLVIF